MTDRHFVFHNRAKHSRTCQCHALLQPGANFSMVGWVMMRNRIATGMRRAAKPIHG